MIWMKVVLWKLCFSTFGQGLQEGEDQEGNKVILRWDFVQLLSIEGPDHSFSPPKWLDHVMGDFVYIFIIGSQGGNLVRWRHWVKAWYFGCSPLQWGDVRYWGTKSMKRGMKKIWWISREGPWTFSCFSLQRARWVTYYIIFDTLYYICQIFTLTTTF